MRKFTAFLLTLILVFSSLTSCIVSNSAGKGDSDDTSESIDGKVGLFDINAPITKKAVTLYKEGGATDIELSFFEGVEDVGMISVSDMVDILNAHVKSERDGEYELEYVIDGDVAQLTRDNGAYCKIDLKEGTVFFNDYNKFNMFSYELGALDILDSDGFNELSEAEYFRRVMGSEKTGEASLIELHERGIPTVLRDGEAYVTLQTFSDIFLTPFEVMIAFNGSDCFFAEGGGLSEELSAEYYAPESDVRSAELIDIAYRHLTLLIDFHYGLKETHGIGLADEYLDKIGLKKELTSEDTAVYFSALKTLTYKYFSDNHSGVLMHSPYNQAPNYSIGADEASIGYWEFYKNYLNYNAMRSEQTANGLTPYSEIGNTAFVVFNSFASATDDYYENSPIGGEFRDEIGLISYAHAMITREDSPIENVVIDLATNTGGVMDGGVYLAAWVLGNAIMHVKDPVRGAEATYIYRADVNLDRVFDEKDTIQDKNVFLITSPITFSCANYVASAFKESGKVTILGTTTGGGTSCVYAATTADGAAIAFSSSLCMSAYKNGSYYLIDEGIAPDVKISDLSYIFDYNKLAQLINTLR